MSGVDVTIGGRVVLIDLPTVMRPSLFDGRPVPCAEYTLNDDELFERLQAIPGFEELGHVLINGIYPATFDADCALTDDELIAAVRRCANLTHKERS